MGLFSLRETLSLRLRTQNHRGATFVVVVLFTVAVGSSGGGNASLSRIWGWWCGFCGKLHAKRPSKRADKVLEALRGRDGWWSDF